MNIDGRPMTLEQFREHVEGLDFGKWKPSLVCVHHCGAPSLEQRPEGFKPQHMLNLKAFYEGKGWRSGPHAFIDETHIWLFTPLTERGVHAVSFNRNAWGLEMLGNYDVEDPTTGRGRRVIGLTAQAVRVLLDRLGAGTDAVRFHRDDPRTSKTCPGRNVGKEWFLELLP